MNYLPRKCRGVALLVSLAVIVQGCSLAIDSRRRIGPYPDRDLKTREDVERILGKPVEAWTLADGRLRAVYEYTVREGNPSLHGEPEIFCLVFTLGLSELLFMPLAYFNKTKRTYLKEYTYDLDGTVADFSGECLKGSICEEWHRSPR